MFRLVGISKMAIYSLDNLSEKLRLTMNVILYCFSSHIRRHSLDWLPHKVVNTTLKVVDVSKVSMVNPVMASKKVDLVATSVEKLIFQ